MRIRSRNYPSFTLVLTDKIDSATSSSSAGHCREFAPPSFITVPDFDETFATETPSTREPNEVSKRVSFSQELRDLQDILSAASEKSTQSRRARRVTTLVIDIALSWKRRLTFRRTRE